MTTELTTTERRNPDSEALDLLTTTELLRLINAEDQKVAIAVREALAQTALAVDAMVAALAKGGRVFYCGAGTSGRLGVLDAVECEPTFSLEPGRIIALIAGGDKAMFRAVEGAEDNLQQARQDLASHGFCEQDIVVAIAASGQTPYALGALAYARELGATSIGVSNNQDTPLLNQCDIPICVEVGPEVLTGSTRMKAGTAQKMLLNMLSTATMVKLGKVYQNLMVDVKASNRKLRNRAERMVMEITGADEEEARRVLAAANYAVKPAVLMHLGGIDRISAERLLKDHDGRLRQALYALKQGQY